ncbi:polynucleotide 5'-hydroxyl-kinase NOL9-like isoform X2 [Argonauta hians]
MSPHGIKGTGKKIKCTSSSVNGPKMLAKKKRKILSETPDIVSSKTASYLRGLKIESSNDLQDKILKSICSSRLYKGRDEGDVGLPPKKKRKFQKNGGVESDSDVEKTIHRSKLKKQQYFEKPSSKVQKWKLTEDTQIYGSSNSTNKGKKKKKLMTFEDPDGVCIYDLHSPSKLKKVKKQKGANHVVNKKKVWIGKCILNTPKGLRKEAAKPKLTVSGSHLKSLTKKQRKELQEIYSLQICSDVEMSDSDGSADGQNLISTKKGKPSLTDNKWAYQQVLSKKKSKSKKDQDYSVGKMKKSKQEHVLEDDSYDNIEASSDDVSDIVDYEEYDEEEEEELDDAEDDDDDDEEDDDEDDDSEGQLSDERPDLNKKNMSNQNLPKHIWIARTEDQAILNLKHPMERNLFGFCEISVLSGGISILDAKITPDGMWHSLYSPHDHTPLKLVTEYAGGKDTLINIKKKVASMLPESDNFLNKIDSTSVIFLVRRLQWPFTDYISTIRPYQGLFQELKEEDRTASNQTLQPFGFGFISKCDDMPDYTSTAEEENLIGKWESLVKSKENPRILLCGSANTGKSTFCRRLLNTCLNIKKSVYFLDCDLGQTEFTPPGCVSLNLVKDFVLGPPFCHQKEPIYNVFVGDITPESSANHYMICIRNVINYYLRLSLQLPLVINTMGWIKGPGKQMLDGILNLIIPDQVIYLYSPKVKLDPHELYPTTVGQNPWNFPGENTEVNAARCNWSLEVLPSPIKPDKRCNKASKLSNAEVRTLVTLAYLGHNWSPNMGLNCCTPYRIKWNLLAIHVCHEVVPFSQIMYAINATVIALCVANLNTAFRYNNDESFPLGFMKRPLGRCLGFGFVRGIDVESQTLYIVSPLTLKTMSQVNTLLRGPISLPLERLQDQQMTDLLYIDRTLETTTGSRTLKRRANMPRHHSSTV